MALTETGNIDAIALSSKVFYNRLLDGLSHYFLVLKDDFSYLQTPE